MKPKRNVSLRKKVGGLFEEPDECILSGPRLNFIFARGDAISLLRIHDEAADGKSGRPKDQLEALKRASLVLAVTAWESFIEDTVTEQLDQLLKRTVIRSLTGTARFAQIPSPGVLELRNPSFG